MRIVHPEAPVTGYMVRNLEYQLGGDLESGDENCPSRGSCHRIYGKNLEYQLGGDLESGAENIPSRGSCHRIYGKKFRIPTGWGS